MAPPQLAADAPVLDVVEPLEVGGLPVVGHEADATGFDRTDRGPGDRMQPARTGLAIVACLACQIDQPLVGQVPLADRTAPIAARHLELVVVHLVADTKLVNLPNDLLAPDLAIEPPTTPWTLLIHCCLPPP